MRLASQGKTKPTTKSNRGALKRWSDEQWLNLNALMYLGVELPCGTKYKGQKDPTVCRPKKKISSKTPTPLAEDLTRAQIEKAIELKKMGKRIYWSRDV